MKEWKGEINEWKKGMKGLMKKWLKWKKELNWRNNQLFNEIMTEWISRKGPCIENGMLDFVEDY